VTPAYVAKRPTVRGKTAVAATEPVTASSETVTTTTALRHDLHRRRQHHHKGKGDQATHAQIINPIRPGKGQS